MSSRRTASWTSRGTSLPSSVSRPRTPSAPAVGAPLSSDSARLGSAGPPLPAISICASGAVAPPGSGRRDSSSSARARTGFVLADRDRQFALGAEHAGVCVRSRIRDRGRAPPACPRSPAGARARQRDLLGPSLAGLESARSAQYRAATGSRFTVSPRSSRITSIWVAKGWPSSAALRSARSASARVTAAACQDRRGPRICGIRRSRNRPRRCPAPRPRATGKRLRRCSWGMPAPCTLKGRFAARPRTPCRSLPRAAHAAVPLLTREISVGFSERRMQSSPAFSAVSAGSGSPPRVKSGQASAAAGTARPRRQHRKQCRPKASRGGGRP